ncbi:MAG: hypothetical protein GTO40_25155 [Deltaproteobacteria bacterium]|nr:hypothetical protein [Deltaproteobacteria bacterium]
MGAKNTEKRVCPMRLLDQVRDVIRKKHCSIRTEQPYVQWIKRYILFHKKRHPKYLRESVSGSYFQVCRAGSSN